MRSLSWHRLVLWGTLAALIILVLWATTLSAKRAEAHDAGDRAGELRGAFVVVRPQPR
jgi:hypothetical protein